MPRITPALKAWFGNSVVVGTNVAFNTDDIRFANTPTQKEASMPRYLQFTPDQYNEVPVSAKVVRRLNGITFSLELEPDLDSDNPEEYFEVTLWATHKDGSREVVDSLSGIDTRDAEYINYIARQFAIPYDLVPKRKDEAAPGRLSSTYEYRNRTAKVYKDPEWDEFVVQFWVDGEHLKDADYFTDDKADAQGTAKAWIADGKNESSRSSRRLAKLIARRKES